MKLEITRGDDYIIRIRNIRDPDDLIVDVSGDTFILTVKVKKLDPDVLAVIQKTRLAEADATSVAGGIDIQLTALETNIPARRYFYDVQWQRTASGAGEIVTLHNTEFVVIQDVTVTI